MPQLLYTCERTMLPIELGGWVGLKSWSGYFGEKKNLLLLLGFKIPDHPTHNLVTTLTLLFHCLIEIKTPSYWN